MAADPSSISMFLRSTSGDIPSPDDDICCSPLSFRLPPAAEETSVSPNGNSYLGVYGFEFLPDSAAIAPNPAKDPDNIEGEATLGHRFSFSLDGLISDAAEAAAGIIEGAAACSITTSTSTAQQAGEESWRDRACAGEEEEDDDFEFSRGGAGGGGGFGGDYCGHAPPGLLLLPVLINCGGATSSSTMNMGAMSVVVDDDHGHQRAVSLDLPPAATGGDHRRRRKLKEHLGGGIDVRDLADSAGSATSTSRSTSTSTSATVDSGRSLNGGMACAAACRRSNSGSCRKYATKLAELLISPAAHGLSLQSRIRRRGRSDSDSAAAAGGGGGGLAFMKSMMEKEEAPQKEKAAASSNSSPNFSTMSTMLPPRSSSSSSSSPLWNPFSTGRSRSRNRKPEDDGDGGESRRSRSSTTTTTMSPSAASAKTSFQSLLPPRSCSARRNCEDVGDAPLVVRSMRSRNISAAPSTVTTTATEDARSFQFLPWPARSCSANRKPDDDGVLGENSKGESRRRSRSARTPAAAAAGYMRSPSSIHDGAVSSSSIDRHRPQHRSKASPWTPGHHIHTYAYETPPWDGLRRRPKETVFRTHSGHNKIMYPIATSPTLNLALYRGTSSKTFKLRNLLFCTNDGKEKLTTAMVKC